MVQVSYPGVYIQEKPSGVRTITGVATSIAAFVGFTRRGLPDRAVMITSFADFERQYGGVARASPASCPVAEFFPQSRGRGESCRRVGRLRLHSTFPTTARGAHRPLGHAP